MNEACGEQVPSVVAPIGSMYMYQLLRSSGTGALRLSAVVADPIRSVPWANWEVLWST